MTEKQTQVLLRLLQDEEQELHDARTALTQRIERYVAAVKEALDAIIGFEKIKKKKYDLIIIDFFMPKVSGRELLEKIKSDNTLNKTKTVFLTVATFSESGQQELKKLGNTDYIQKPFENENFIKRIKKALAEK